MKVGYRSLKGLRKTMLKEYQRVVDEAKQMIGELAQDRSRRSLFELWVRMPVRGCKSDEGTLTGLWLTGSGI
jgi:hypothetical protein